MHFSFPATIHSRNSLVIWLGIFNFKLILKVLKYKYIRGLRMLMCSASFSSSLSAPYHWRFLNKFCCVNIFNWCYFSVWLKTAYRFYKQNSRAEACCSRRSCSWKTLCDFVHIWKEWKAADSGSLALALLHHHDPRPQNVIRLEQLSKHLTVNICSVPLLHSHSYSSSLPVSFLIHLWGKRERVLCVV